MTPEQALGLGVFALGIAANAGIVWKGLSIVERELLRLREAVHDHQNGNAKTMGELEGEMEALQKDVELLKRKVFGI